MPQPESIPSFAETLHERLGDHADAVGAVLPELARALGWRDSAAAGPESFAETRSIQALAAFLDALGAKDRPAMIILDDCQWADATTVKLIAQLAAGAGQLGRRRSSDVAGRRLSFGGSAGRSPAPHDFARRFICGWLPWRPTKCSRLLESMAGPLPAEAVEVVSKLSDGSPFMASAVLRGMVESGALAAEPSGWRIEPSALADLQSSSRSAGFLSRRIELLPHRHSRSRDDRRRARQGIRPECCRETA